jgi:hypothetical protein
MSPAGQVEGEEDEDKGTWLCKIKQSPAKSVTKPQQEMTAP